MCEKWPAIHPHKSGNRKPSDVLHRHVLWQMPEHWSWKIREHGWKQCNSHCLLSFLRRRWGRNLHLQNRNDLWWSAKAVQVFPPSNLCDHQSLPPTHVLQTRSFHGKNALPPWCSRFADAFPALHMLHPTDLLQDIRDEELLPRSLRDRSNSGRADMPTHPPMNTTVHPCGRHHMSLQAWCGPC